ncbi:hypothetical protein R1sor_002021 [Riccia sorocarpa]|uniref:Uncharacterized protein n=1 Tax=Riccia sorocarpa TaxID=122646 RepID=A0ABD3H098_9MARC
MDSTGPLLLNSSARLIGGHKSGVNQLINVFGLLLDSDLASPSAFSMTAAAIIIRFASAFPRGLPTFGFGGSAWTLRGRNFRDSIFKPSAYSSWVIDRKPNSFKLRKFFIVQFYWQDLFNDATTTVEVS